MNNMKKLPIGIDDFKTIIENNYFYADKTRLIEEILEDGAFVKLFTRPRRFGKTLNMSMIKYFFDIKEVNKNLFDNLYISQSKYITEQGKYPVIFISLKDLKALSWEECKEKIRNLISDLYGEYKFITEKMDEIDKKYFYKIRSKEKDESYENSLKNLTRYLYEYYSQKVIILIDEYDTPLISAYENNFYKESINFFKTFYGSVLKSNIYLQTEVMTGILRVAKEWIFSDLNNITVYTVLDKEYSSYFGLTEKEVIEATHEYNVRDNIEQIKKWYDGYNFGGVEIYNPWSILNYLSRKRLDSYWVNTSNDYLIIDLLKNSNMDLFEDLKKVFYNGVTEQIIDIFSNMDNLKNSQEIWQLMLYSGYLTVEEKIDEITFKLRLPNYEVRTFFERLL